MPNKAIWGYVQSKSDRVLSDSGMIGIKIGSVHSREDKSAELQVEGKRNHSHPLPSSTVTGQVASAERTHAAMPGVAQPISQWLPAPRTRRGQLAPKLGAIPIG